MDVGQPVESSARQKSKVHWQLPARPVDSLYWAKVFMLAVSMSNDDIYANIIYCANIWLTKEDYKINISEEGMT